MRITVLGKSPSWQDTDGACSGYLVQEGETALLLDCGTGVFAKLRRFCDYTDVDAVLITHLHADHFLDLIPFSYALTHAPRPQSPVRPLLYLPADAVDVLRRIVGSWGAEDLIENAFDVREYAAADELTVGPLAVRFCKVPHYITTFAVEVAGGGARLTYSADCGPNDELAEFARDTDLLLIEATLHQPEQSAERGHLTAREAGQHGARARARRLVITHFSDELDLDRVRAEAGQGYGGSVELAVEGAAYALSEQGAGRLAEGRL